MQRDASVEDKRERLTIVPETPPLHEPPLQAVNKDPLDELVRLRADLRDAYRGADCNHPDEDVHRLWNEIHEIQKGLDEPVTTILIKVRKSRSNVPLVLYCDDRKERRRELKLFPGTVEVLSPVMPVTLTYVLHPPHSGGDLPHPPGGPPHFAGGPPFLGAFPPPHLGGPPLPPGPPPVPARRIDLKNRELVIEFEFSAMGARWKHRLHPPPSARKEPETPIQLRNGEGDRGRNPRGKTWTPSCRLLGQDDPLHEPRVTVDLSEGR